MFLNKLHPFIVREEERSELCLCEVKMRILGASTRPSAVMPVTQQLKHRSPSCLSRWRPALDGWSSALRRARRLRWEVYFVSHSWFYFSTTGGRVIEGGREEDWYHSERLQTSATWASCSQFRKEAFAAVRRSGALTERKFVLYVILLLQSEIFCSRKSLKKEKKERSGRWTRASLLWK